jgi:hypothetical protein
VAVILHRCPHCQNDLAALVSQSWSLIEADHAVAIMRCSICWLLNRVQFDYQGGVPGPVLSATDLPAYVDDPVARGWTVTGIWREPAASSTPAHPSHPNKTD